MELDLLNIEIVKVIVVEIERVGIEAINSDEIVRVENIDAISAMGEKYSDSVGRNVLYALLNTIAAGREFLGFSGASNYRVNRQTIYYSNTLSKGCEKEKIVEVNYTVSS